MIPIFENNTISKAVYKTHPRRIAAETTPKISAAGFGVEVTLNSIVIQLVTIENGTLDFSKKV